MPRQDLERDAVGPSAERAVDEEQVGITSPAPATGACGGEGGRVAGRRGRTVIGVEDVVGGGGRGRGAEDGVLGAEVVLGVEAVLGGGGRRGAENGVIGGGRGGGAGAGGRRGGGRRGRGVLGGVLGGRAVAGEGGGGGRGWRRGVVEVGVEVVLRGRLLVLGSTRPAAEEAHEGAELLYGQGGADGA